MGLHVPKYVLFISVLSTIPLLIGCSEDSGNTEQEGHDTYIPFVEVIAIGPGWEIPANSSIILVFNMAIDHAEISVSESAGDTRIRGDQAIWTPKIAMSQGAHILSVYAEFGDLRMENAEKFEFKAVTPDNVQPRIDNTRSNPVNEATDVNPDDYLRGLAIAFTESMLDIEVVSANPGFEFTERLRYSDGDMLLYLDFVDYKMPYDTEFRITLSGTDFSRNELATTEYWFRTKKE